MNILFHQIALQLNKLSTCGNEENECFFLPLIYEKRSLYSCAKLAVRPLHLI